MAETSGSEARETSGSEARETSGSEAREWVDSHCHLGMLAEAAEPLARAREAGVVGMVCVGTDLPTSHHAVEIADRHPDVWATVGLHPHDASRLSAEWGQLEMLAHAVGLPDVNFTQATVLIGVLSSAVQRLPPSTL